MDELNPAPTTETVEQPTEQRQDAPVVADAPGTSEPVAETDEQKAERLVKERQIREQRGRRNQEAAFRRLEAERERDRELMREMVKALQVGRQPDAPKPPADEAPKRDDYDDYESYVVAKAAYEGEKRAFDKLNKQIAESLRLHQETTAKQEASHVDNSHFTRAQEFARTVPDFEEVTAREDVFIPPAASEAIKRSVDGPQILYAIGKQPELAARMRGMSDLEQAVYVGQLSGWVSSQSPQISNAAPAGRPVASRPAASSSPPEDPEAYMAWANKKFGKR